MIDRPQYESQVLDHLGLVAGMFDELGIGDILDQATQQNPHTRDLTVGEAVKPVLFLKTHLMCQKYVVLA